MDQKILFFRRLAACLLSTLVLLGTMAAQTHTTEHLTQPYDFIFPGCSEPVHAFGTLDIVVQVTSNGRAQRSSYTTRRT